jgi:hypothetical protein
MARVGLVPHHIGEWFGFGGTTFWYVTLAALLLAPLLVAFAWRQGESHRETAGRVVLFLATFAVAMIPALTPPQDSSELFKLHPAIPFVPGWEPAGRDRITALKEKADAYGTRGIGPCLWYRAADLERVVHLDALAARDEARAKNTIPKEQCPKVWF